MSRFVVICKPIDKTYNFLCCLQQHQSASFIRDKHLETFEHECNNTKCVTQFINQYDLNCVLRKYKRWQQA